MPIIFVGAEIEPREIHAWALFEVNRLCTKEINERAWRYLRLIGFTWYREVAMSVSLGKRGEVDLLTIEATAEHNFAPLDIRVEVPLKQFEAMVAPRPQEKEPPAEGLSAFNVRGDPKP